MRLILTWCAAAASVFGLFFTLHPAADPVSGSEGALLALLGVVFVVAAYFDIRDQRRNRPKRYRDLKHVNDYMFRWISRAGRVVIYTRDHSWAEEARIRDLLVTKAKHDELTVCLPKPTALTEELHSLGAEIVTYPDLDYWPGARFTLVNDGRAAEAAVAIGRKEAGVHVIEEFPSGDPVYAVTKDLVEVLRRLKK